MLGCGIDVCYPRHHKKLMSEVEQCGAVLTEYPPGTPPNGYHFPIRNRLISALSDAVLVVEAPENSGALITARYAILQGRILYTVPGDITNALCAGSNKLLQLGARPALCAEDVLSVLRSRYADALCEDSFREALQYSTLSEKALGAYGVRAAGENVKRGRVAKRAEKKESDRAGLDHEAPG